MDSALEKDGGLAWLDPILLLTGWLAMLFSAVAAWASHSRTIGTVGAVLGGTRWAYLLLDLHVVLVGLVAILPLLLVLARRMPTPRSWLDRWASGTVRRSMTLGLLAAFGLLQLLYFPDIGRLQFTVTFVCILVVVLLAFTLLLGANVRRLRVSISAATWMALVLTARMTLEELRGFARGQTGAPWALVWSVVFGALLALLILVPLGLFVPRFRRRLVWIQERAVLVSAGPASCIILLASLVGVLYREGDAGVSGLWALARFAACLALLVGWAVMLRRRTESSAEPSPVAPPSRLPAHWVVIAILVVVYIVQAVRIAANVLYYLNPDGIAYLIIARDYARGMAVVRGYWSPLMPWLLAPWIRLGTNAQVAQRVLVGIAGLAWVFVSLRLGKRFGLGRMWQVALTATMIVIALQQAFIPVTPDLLGAVVLGIYFLLVTSDRLVRHPLAVGTLAGVLGALAFYAKFYNLPFFAVHILLTGMLLCAGGRSWRRAAAGVITSWLVAGLLLLPWALALRARYGQLTLTTSGPINHALYGPSQSGHPCWDQRLCGQPPDTLIPWEDPQAADYADLGWSVFGSWDNFRYEILQVQANLGDFFGNIAFRFGPLAPVGMVIGALAAFSLRHDRARQLSLLWILMTVLLYAAGYMPFAGDLRYYLPIVPVAVVGAYRVVQEAVEGFRASGTPVFAPMAQAILALALTLTFLDPQSAGLRSLPPADPCAGVQTAQLANRLIAPIAGTDATINKIAFYSQRRTVGVLRESTSAPDADTELRTFGVRTYVLKQGSALADALLARGDYSVLASPTICGTDYVFLRTPVP